LNHQSLENDEFEWLLSVLFGPKPTEDKVLKSTNLFKQKSKKYDNNNSKEIYLSQLFISGAQ
jgi:hypothetical protein